MNVAKTNPSEEYFDLRRSRRIVRQVDIVKVARQYLKLSKAGPLFIGRCPLNSPLHRGMERMFIISPKNRSFYCFGCGRSGSVILLVMMAGGVEFIDAVEYLENNFLPSRCLVQVLSIPEREGHYIPSFRDSGRNPL